MFFPNTFQNYFLSPFRRPGAPKSRRIEFVWTVFGAPLILRGPKNRPKPAKGRQNTLKTYPGHPHFRGPETDTAPRHHLGWIFDGIWMDLGLIFYAFCMIFKSIFRHAGAVWMFFGPFGGAMVVGFQCHQNASCDGFRELLGRLRIYKYLLQLILQGCSLSLSLGAKELQKSIFWVGAFTVLGADLVPTSPCQPDFDFPWRAFGGPELLYIH